jgi:N-hydroxyarylamine O-acetyltransferase
MNAFQPDLPRYFQRIGYAGAAGMGVDTLHDLSALHAAAIPYENWDVLLGRSIDLSPAVIEQKLVHAGRGGYCFEQNEYMLRVLQALGFTVSALSARVRWLLPREVTPPRAHLFNCVQLGAERWLVDVGLGGGSLSAPILWQEGLVQSTPHDERRIIRLGDVWLHQLRWDAQSEWHDLFEFTGEAMAEIDRAMANWWTSTNTSSKFKNNLILSQADSDGTRRNLQNTEYTLRRQGQPAQRRLLTSVQQLHEVLNRDYRLPIPLEECETVCRSLPVLQGLVDAE